MKKRMQLTTTVIFLMLLATSIVTITGCKPSDSAVELINDAGPVRHYPLSMNRSTE